MSRRRSQPKRGGRQVFAMGSDPADPTGFFVTASDWVEWMRTHNFSQATLVQLSFYLSKFVPAERQAACRGGVQSLSQTDRVAGRKPASSAGDLRGLSHAGQVCG